MWTRWRGVVARQHGAARSSWRLSQHRALWTHTPGTSASEHATPSANSPAEAAQLIVQDPESRAKKSLDQILYMIRNTRSSERLDLLWGLMTQGQPFIITGTYLRTVGAEALKDENEEYQQRIEAALADRAPIRVVSFQEMLDLARAGKRHHVVERGPVFTRSPSTITADEEYEKLVKWPEITLTDDSEMLVSRLFVTLKFVKALDRLGDRSALGQLVDDVESELDALRTRELAQCASDDDRALVEELTTLGSSVDALYTIAMTRCGAFDKVVARCDKYKDDLSRFVFNRDAFRSLLRACQEQRDGDLAKEAIDQMFDRFPLVTFNLRVFTLALHANLRGKKELTRLQNAMHIFRRATHDAGYVLPPAEWSMLFNACVYQNQHEMVLEVFESYKRHGVAPFQSRFQQAVRMVCRFKQFDTAIAMARTWSRIEAEEPRQTHGYSEERLRDDEAEVVNRIFWEMQMHKEHASLAQVEQVLEIMQQRGLQAGAIAIRRFVTKFFDDDDTRGSETEAGALVSEFFAVLERYPTVIQRTAFVLHLVLELCEARDWTDQGERVIKYAVEENFELPIPSTIKVMERYASRGQFEDAIRLGELSLKPFEEALKEGKHTVSNRIPDKFFEALLTSYLFRERFEDVLKMDEAFQLTESRALSNVKLATILREARSMLL